MSRDFTPANKDGVHQANALSWALDKRSGLYYLATIPKTPTAIVTGRKTVSTATSAVQFTATATPCYRVDVCADLGNTNPVVVGDASVVAASDSQQGIILIPGNPPFTILIDDLSKLYVDAQSDGDSVCYAYYTL